MRPIWNKKRSRWCLF